MIYKRKVLKYFEGQKKKGLKYVHFSFTEQAKNMPEEEIYEEIWRMINAPDMPDPEVLGGRSL